MPTEENKARQRRVFDELNRGNLTIFDEVIAPTYVYHTPVGTEVKGPEGATLLCNVGRATVPDRAKAKAKVEAKTRIGYP